MEKTIKIKGMTCDHCVNRVKKELEGICGVKSADVSLKEGKAVVKLVHDVEDEKIKKAVDEAGYEVVSIIE